MPGKKGSRNYRFWTASELEVLKRGIKPEGRSVHSCHLVCSRLGIPFPGQETFRDNEDLLNKFKDHK